MSKKSEKVNESQIDFLGLSAEEGLPCTRVDCERLREMGMTELKSCPFCGCELEFKRYTRGYPIIIEYFDIRHPDNGCILSDFDASYTNYDALLKQWNRRVSE